MACASKMNANPNSKQILTTNHKSESKMIVNINSELILNEIWIKHECKFDFESILNANCNFETIYQKIINLSQKIMKILILIFLLLKITNLNQQIMKTLIFIHFIKKHKFESTNYENINFE